MPTELHPTSSHRRVLLVEDESRLREMLVRALSDMEFQVQSAATAEDGLQILQDNEIDILLTDLNLPGMGGLELCQLIRNQWPDRQVIILTGYGDLQTAKQAIRLDVVDFLTKPCSLSDLEASLDRALRRRLNHIIPRTIGGQDLDDSFEIDDESQAPRTLRELEREHIIEALHRHEGSRSAAAYELGISERTLYYRLKEYQEQGHIVPKSTTPDP